MQEGDFGSAILKSMDVDLLLITRGQHCLENNRSLRSNDGSGLHRGATFGMVHAGAISDTGMEARHDDVACEPAKKTNHSTTMRGVE